MEDDNRPQNSDSDVTLWDYSLRVYADKVVSQACLAAQDTYNVDVCLLLYLAWLAHRGEQISKSQLGQVVNACEDWRNAVVLPLRKQRRRWKAVDSESWEYAALKRLEQQAERDQLQAMEASFSHIFQAEASGGTARQSDIAYCLSENLKTLAAALSLPESALADFRGALDGV